jgi:hypothetical protein
VGNGICGKQPLLNDEAGRDVVERQNGAVHSDAAAGQNPEDGLGNASNTAATSRGRVVVALDAQYEYRERFDGPQVDFFLLWDGESSHSPACLLIRQNPLFRRAVNKEAPDCGRQ